MKIQIVAIRLVDPKESGLRGFADVRLDNTILIRDFRILQRNGKPSVEGPHTTFKKDGQIRFNDVVNFPVELKVQIETMILTAFFRERERENAEAEK